MSNKNNQKKIVLVDGSSYLFRAYHALPPLTNSKGTPTGAIYGVINMLKKLLKDEEPDYIAVVFDTKGKTFRHELYAEYKANRPEMPEELRVQIQPLHDLIQAMGLPLITHEGVEADDVIGTLAELAKNKNMAVLVSTGDKDFAQLVDDQVTLVNTMTGTVMDEKGVVNKFGVPPNRIKDYLALIGDTVDNVPGVPKVGPKTAVKWLSQYDSLENILAKQDEFTGKIGENLRNTAEYLPLAYELVSIKLDVPIDEKPEDLVILDVDTEKLREMYTDLEFKTWLKELNSGLDRTSSQVVSNAEYHCITSEKDFNELLKQLKQAKIICFDTETTSLDTQEAEIVGLSFSIKEGEAFYIPVGHDYLGAPEQLDREKVLNNLKPILEDNQIEKVGQNLKYDCEVLANYNIEVANIAFDTMLESYVLNSTASRHTMDALAKYYLNYEPISYETVAGKGAKQVTFNQVEVPVATNYAAEDADITLKLHNCLWPKVQNDAQLSTVYTKVEQPLIKVLAKMETTGVKIDVSMLNKQSETLAKELIKLEEEAYTIAGENFNLASPKQLQGILFDKLGLPMIAKTPKGQPSTAESVLQELSLDYELPQIILNHRSLSKLKSTYTDKLPLMVSAKTERVHCSYHQAVTATGRLSSSDPNLQNIPIRTEEGRKIRKAFIAEKGFSIVAADYSQVELRIMAHLSEDKGLIQAFKKGIDIHQYTAHEIFGVELDKVTSDQRRSAKAINFGLIYGMSAFGLAKQLNVPRDAATEYMDVYFKRYPGVKDYMAKTRETAAKEGYVETLLGRRLYLPDIKSKNKLRKNAAERVAINAPMQGTAADIIKLAMIELHEWVCEHSDLVKMIMQVHDELVFEVENTFLEVAKDKIQTVMENAYQLTTPLVVSVGVGNNWEEAH